MNQLDTLTVAITSFKREWHLERAIASARNAGIRRLVVATSEPTPGILRILDREKEGWLSFDVAGTRDDIGCNSTWMLAAYRSRTDRILLLHDDDVILPEFGEAYCRRMAPMLDAGVGFVSWRANHLFDDGTTHVTEYWTGPTRVAQSKELERLVARFGALSLSPIVSVLDRTTIIRACKEAEETLTHNECLYRPGMLLGTEILVYLRHIKAKPTWFYMDELLTMYGHTESSGTVQVEKTGNISSLVKGYDRARVQGVMHRAPSPKPKIILVHGYGLPPADDAERQRMANAAYSREHHFGQFDMIDREVFPGDIHRTSSDLGDSRPTVYLRDYLDLGCEMALPEDIVAFTNSDIGLTGDAAARILAGVERGRGVTVCPRRVLDHPAQGRIYRSVRNCKVDGGMDVIAVSPHWWDAMKDAMPDMLLGREAWDLCFRTLAEEWIDGPAMKSALTIIPSDWWISRAYTDDVCWHEPHDSFWKTDRSANLGGAHNRALARKFFEARRNLMGLACVAEPASNKIEPTADGSIVSTVPSSDGERDTKATD